MFTDKDEKFYLAGPMSGVPQFNIPAFDAATRDLRSTYGIRVVSPVELDRPAVRRACLSSPDGKLTEETGGGETWGDFLARDVRLIADQCAGVILMDGWTASRGARLEAFVGLLTGKKFYRYYATGSSPEHRVVEWHPETVRGYIRSSMP